MIVVAVFLIGLPLANAPGWPLAAFGLVLSGIPVYLVVVMETPWKIRPVFLDKWSGKKSHVCMYIYCCLLCLLIELITRHGNRLLNSKSARSLR